MYDACLFVVVLCGRKTVSERGVYSYKHFYVSLFVSCSRSTPESMACQRDPVGGRR